MGGGLGVKTDGGGVGSGWGRVRGVRVDVNREFRFL